MSPDSCAAAWATLRYPPKARIQDEIVVVPDVQLPGDKQGGGAFQVHRRQVKDERALIVADALRDGVVARIVEVQNVFFVINFHNVPGAERDSDDAVYFAAQDAGNLRQVGDKRSHVVNAGLTALRAQTQVADPDGLGGRDAFGLLNGGIGELVAVHVQGAVYHGSAGAGIEQEGEVFALVQSPCDENLMIFVLERHFHAVAVKHVFGDKPQLSMGRPRRAHSAAQHKREQPQRQASARTPFCRATTARNGSLGLLGLQSHRVFLSNATNCSSKR